MLVVKAKEGNLIAISLSFSLSLILFGEYTSDERTKEMHVHIGCKIK
jgi:hypothetical protein